MNCLQCLCVNCANNVDSDHKPEEIDIFCYHCDEAPPRAVGCHVSECPNHKPTIKSIEREAIRRRKQMRLVQKEQPCNQ